MTDVEPMDGQRVYRCHARHRLTGQRSTSAPARIGVVLGVGAAAAGAADGRLGVARLGRAAALRRPGPAAGEIEVSPVSVFVSFLFLFFSFFFKWNRSQKIPCGPLNVDVVH